MRQAIASRERPPATQRGQPVERRQLTVIFCDLIGSTALFEELDPEEVGELLRAFTQCCAAQIEAAGGFVAQFQGDGVIGYFGYTEANESNAERAVRAGLDIVSHVPLLPARGGRPLQTRVGIATGLAVVGDPHAGGTRLEQSAVGQTLHLAARLQAAASPNQVIIAQSTRRLTGDLFICRGASKLDLKGFNEPIQAWRVVGPKPVVTKLRTHAHPGLAPMVNRNTEIENLSRAWRRVTAGRGQVVTISGNAGIGKSRLVNALRREIGATRHLWLEAGGAQFFQNTPFYPVAQLIRRVFDPAGRKPAAEIQANLERSMQEAGIRAPEALPLIIEMLGLGVSATLTVPPEERRDQLFSTLADWILGLARTRPLVIVLEDLHWIDPSTLELIAFMVPRVRTLAVLMLLTARSELRVPWPERGHASRLNLARLSDDCLHDIVTTVINTIRPPGKGTGFARPLTEDNIRSIVQRAEGVPLFGIELTRLIEEPKAAPTDRVIPATLAALLAARLDQLGPAAKSVAQAAAVFGDQIPLPVLEAVMAIPMSRLRPRLATLKRKAVFREEGPESSPVYQFTHALLRDSAYDALPRAQRRDLHRRVATVIEARPDLVGGERPERLAYQWTEAGDLARGAAAWQKAADLFRHNRAFSEAEQAYKNAATALAGLPESLERDIQELALRGALAEVLQITHGYAAPPTVEAFDRIRDLAERTGDREQRCRHIFGAWAAASSGGNYPLASGLADQFYQMAIDDPIHRAQACMVQMTARFRIGELPAAEDYFLQGQAVFAASGLERRPGAVAQIYGNAAQIAWILGNDAAARERMDHALLVSRHNDDPYDLASTHFMAALFEICAGNFSEAAELSNEAIRLSDRFKFPQFGTIARISLGRANAGLGFASQGLTLIRQGLDGMAGTSSRVALTVYMTWLAEAHLLAGSIDQALETAHEALSVNPHELFFRPETLRLRGKIRLRDAKPGEAEQDFLDAVVLAKRMGAIRFVDRATASLRKLLQAHGDIQAQLQGTSLPRVDELSHAGE